MDILSPILAFRAAALIPPRIAPVSPAATSVPAAATVPAPAASAPVVAMPSSSSSSPAPILVTAAAAAPATPASSAISALLAWPRFIHAQRASLDLFAVQLRDRILRVRIRGHRHERESAGLARELVLHQKHLGYCAGLRKHVLQLQFSRRERKVAYIQSISHNGLDFLLQKVARLSRKYVAESDSIDRSC